MIKNYINPEVFQIIGAAMVWAVFMVFFLKIYFTLRKEQKLYFSDNNGITK